MKFFTAIIVAFPIIAEASPLPDYSFKSPAFNGNGYGTYQLQLENTQFTRQQAVQQALQAAQQQAAASAQNTPVNQFLANLQSRIYAQISQNLATSMFKAGTTTQGNQNIKYFTTAKQAGCLTSYYRSY